MSILSDITSFAELSGLAATLPVADAAAAQAATARQMSLTKPPGALGRLEELAIFMAGWQRVERPAIDRAQALVFAGNHGVCAQGVNPFPQEVTAQMVANFAAGGAAINQLCRVAGAELSVIACDLDRPTGDITQAEAMTEAETLAEMRRGAEAVAEDAQIVLLGEMGIGNSTVAAALALRAAAPWTPSRTTSSPLDGPAAWLFSSRPLGSPAAGAARRQHRPRQESALAT